MRWRRGPEAVTDPASTLAPASRPRISASAMLPAPRKPMVRSSDKLQTHTTLCHAAAMDRFDVVVIGGGLVGSSTAMHLARRGGRSIAIVPVELGGRYSSSELNAGGVRATWRTEVN